LHFGQQPCGLGAADLGDVVLVLQQHSERFVHAPGGQFVLVQVVQRRRPIYRLGDTGQLEQIRAAQPLHEGHDLPRQARRQARRLRIQDRPLPRGVGIVHPLIQAAAADRVMHLAGTVAGQHHHRRHAGAYGAVFRHRDLEIRQQLQQECLEWLVRTVQLVNQQHGRRQVGVYGGQQRPGQQIRPAVDRRGQPPLVPVPAGLRQAYRHQLPGMVPFVGRGGQVHAVIALQPH